MAKNKVEIDVIVDDKGTTKKVGLNAKKAGEGLDDVGKGARTADRNLKGAAQASSNTTKNFSKMAQGISGGLVPAYATLAANIFAISAAFNFLKTAGDLSALEKAQVSYANKTGLSMKLLTSRIQEASGEIISFQEASQAAAIGIAAGLSPDQLERLGAAAKNAAAALGRDTADAFQRLTRGAIKAEPELLDELGIIIRLEKASEDYKTAMGGLTRELTTFEKTQAVVNATLEQAEEKFDDVGDSVNEVAKLGKAFDDLVKQIQRFIVGPAEFLANVFTKNILALAAAFALLGVNITKAITPAAPQIEDLSKVADAAKRRVQAAVVPTTATGKAVLAGDFGEAEMRRLQIASDANTSTIIQGSKKQRQSLQKDLKLIQASHARTMAANSTGFKKYRMGVIADLKLMQAEHGRVMGTMKMGVGALGRFASRAMNAIAIVGVITLAVSMAKELLNLLKSDELKALERTAETLKNRFEEQNSATKEMVENLEKASSPMGRLLQQANILSQLSTRGMGRIIQSLPEIGVSGTYRPGIDTSKMGVSAAITSLGRDRIADAQRTRETMAPALKEAIASLRLIQQEATKAGLDTGAFEKKLDKLEKTQKEVGDANLYTWNGLRVYNTGVRQLKHELPGLIKEGNALTGNLAAQQAAYLSLGQQVEQFISIQKAVAGKTSTVYQLIGIFDSISESLKTFEGLREGATLGAFADEKTITDLQTILGLTEAQVRALTQKTTLDLLSAKSEKLETSALGIAKGPHEAQKLLNEGMMTYLPFLQQEAQHKKKLADIDQRRAEITHEFLMAEEAGISLSDEKSASLKAENAALEAQSLLIKQNFSDIGRLGKAMGESLEQGLGSAINGLVTGAMNVKEAFASMAQSVLQSIAKVLAEMMAVQLIKSAFGGTSFGTFLGLPGAATGGILSEGKKMQGYSTGGIAKGSKKGYPAILHGTEAVVPLPNGKSIPVEMKNGGSTQNNVVVNISTDGTSQTRESSGMDSERLGKAIASAVQEELLNQKRSGGILNPYGAS